MGQVDVRDVGATAGGYAAIGSSIAFAVRGLALRSFKKAEIESLLRWAAVGGGIGGFYGVVFEGFRALFLNV